MELREKLAEKQFRNADSYRKRREFKSSLIYYDIVLDRYYDSEFADDAMYGKAKVYIEQEEYQKARELLLEFKDKFADSELIEKVEKSIQDLKSEENKDDDS